MSNLHKAERVIAKHLGSSDPYSITAGQAAESLEAAGLLAPDVRIIRTAKELEALDPDTVFMNGWGDLFDPDNIYSGIGLEEDHDYYFPCVLVATGTQVRYARETLEEEDD